MGSPTDQWGTPRRGVCGGLMYATAVQNNAAVTQTSRIKCTRTAITRARHSMLYAQLAPFIIISPVTNVTIAFIFPISCTNQQNISK